MHSVNKNAKSVKYARLNVDFAVLKYYNNYNKSFYIEETLMNRKTARENAFILLFEGASKTDETAAEIFEKATAVRGLECDEYVKRVFFGVYENARVIEEYVDKSLVGWKRERVSIASLAILRLATYELMFMEDIPTKVSINEAVELAKKYDDEKAYSFVNGVLNAIAKEAEAK